MPTLSWPKTELEVCHSAAADVFAHIPFRRLDLDDLRAHVGQHAGAMRTGNRGRKIQHAKALKALCRIP